MEARIPHRPKRRCPLRENLMELNFTIEKPSRLIRMGLEALLEYEQKPNFKIDMYLYHYTNKGVCFACLGGVTALKYYKIPDEALPRIEVRSDLYSYGAPAAGDVGALERALNYARMGLIEDMFLCLGTTPRQASEVGRKFERPMYDYHTNRSGFFDDMENLASDLEAAGY